MTDRTLDESRLLTPEELSHELQLPKSTIYKLCSEGEIPAAKIGKHWRFDRKRVDAWLAERFAAQAASRRPGAEGEADE